jgi:hypothetical protein
VAANAVIGGWTIGTIVTWQSGEPQLLAGGTSPFNQNDGGITLNNVTPSQLQHQMHARRVPGKPYVSLFDPKFINQVNGQANSAYITPEYTPGQIGRLLWLHAPSNFNTDLSLTKSVPIYKEMNLRLQGVFLNAFNHVSWLGMSAANANVQSSTFGTTTTLYGIGPRQIEVRANLQF